MSLISSPVWQACCAISSFGRSDSKLLRRTWRMERCCGRRFSHRSQLVHAGSPQGLDGEEDGWPQHRLVGDIHPSPVQSLKGSSTCRFSCLCWGQRRSAWLETAPQGSWVWRGNLYTVRRLFFWEPRGLHLRPTATSKAAIFHTCSWFCQFSFLSLYFLELLRCEEDLECGGQATCTWKIFCPPEKSICGSFKLPVSTLWQCFPLKRGFNIRELGLGQGLAGYLVPSPSPLLSPWWIPHIALTACQHSCFMNTSLYCDYRKGWDLNFARTVSLTEATLDKNKKWPE